MADRRVYLRHPFRGGRRAWARHWAAAFSCQDVPSVLAEAIRRADRMARYGLGRATPVRLHDLDPPSGRADPAPWALTCAIDGAGFGPGPGLALRPGPLRGDRGHRRPHRGRSVPTRPQPGRPGRGPVVRPAVLPSAALPRRPGRAAAPRPGRGSGMPPVMSGRSARTTCRRALTSRPPQPTCCAASWMGSQKRLGRCRRRRLVSARVVLAGVGGSAVLAGRGQFADLGGVRRDPLDDLARPVLQHPDVEAAGPVTATIALSPAA